MKINKIIGVIALSTLVSTSCHNSLNVLAPYKDVTVVYGLLDQNDPVHYFRINKGFEGPGNAYTMAMQYDSIYYPVGSIRAYIKDSNVNTQTIVDTFNLDTTTTVPLASGTFSYPKQLLYYTQARKMTLHADDSDYYILVIVNNKTGKTITGTTSLLSDIDFASPGFTNQKNFYLSFDQTEPTIIGWTTTPGARIYQMDIRFYYTEYTNGSNPVLKSIDWLFAPETSPTLGGSVSLNYSITGQGLCSLILHSIPVESFVTRYVDSLGIIFTSGTDDLNTYVQLSQPPSGINQDIPLFTDLKNGVGLFTARHVQTLNKYVSQNLTDTLTMESQYIPLNFQQ